VPYVHELPGTEISAQLDDHDGTFDLPEDKFDSLYQVDTGGCYVEQ
jgi:hypothetical protein